MDRTDYSRISSLQELRAARASLAPQLARISRKMSSGLGKASGKSGKDFPLARILGLGSGPFLKKLNWLEIGLSIFQTIAFFRRFRKK